MAIHSSISSMLKESLPEMLLVAKYCIEFRKDTDVWPSRGCYGYPAALILLSIADSVGSYIEQGSVENHFKILNNPDYYDLKLDNQSLKVIYNYYRNTLSHHGVLALNVVLDIGQTNDVALEKNNGTYILRLAPLYTASIISVNKFLSNPQILDNNKTIINLQKKL